MDELKLSGEAIGLIVGVVGVLLGVVGLYFAVRGDRALTRSNTKIVGLKGELGSLRAELGLLRTQLRDGQEALDRKNAVVEALNGLSSEMVATLDGFLNGVKAHPLVIDQRGLSDSVTNMLARVRAWRTLRESYTGKQGYLPATQVAQLDFQQPDERPPEA